MEKPLSVFFCFVSCVCQVSVVINGCVSLICKVYNYDLTKSIFVPLVYVHVDQMCCTCICTSGPKIDFVRPLRLMPVTFHEHLVVFLLPRSDEIVHVIGLIQNSFIVFEFAGIIINNRENRSMKL